MQGFLNKTIGGKNYRVYRDVKCEHEVATQECEPQIMEPSSPSVWQPSFDSREALMEKGTSGRSSPYHISVGELG